MIKKQTSLTTLLGTASIAVLTGLAMPVQAGYITATSATPAWAGTSTFYGYDAWNLYNVTVYETDANGVATANDLGTSFPLDPTSYVGYESQIFNDATKTVHLASLVAKNPPVGEAPGVKVLTDIGGKVPNCIMSTAYLDTGYLDTANPEQVTCNSEFQTHKRYKVRILDAAVSGATPGTYGEGIDMVFNVGADGIARSYKVFQKINNWTNSRLSGFKIEVGFGVGAGFVKAGATTAAADLTLSVPNTDFDADQLAVFSHGLFGPVDSHFPDGGWFDNTNAAGYTIAEYATQTFNDTLTSSTPLAGRYDSILELKSAPVTVTNQFGEWLPYDWAAKGIFYDHDNDPATDAELQAWWGDIGDGTYHWMYGIANDFQVVPDSQLIQWELDPLYSVGEIDDLVNVGLSYLVNIGDVTTFPATTPAGTFTIRITPQLAATSVAPGYVANPPTPVTTPDGGVVDVYPRPTFAITQALSIAVIDSAQNADAGTAETATVQVTDATSTDSEDVVLTETGVNTGVFTGTVPTSAGAVTANDGTLETGDGNTVTVTWDNPGTAATPPTATTTAVLGTTGVLTVPAETNTGVSMTIQVTDADRDTNPYTPETITVTSAVAGGDTQDTVLTETGFNTGIFEGTLAIEEGTAIGANDDKLTVVVGDVITTTYTDDFDATGATGGTVTADTTVTATPVTPPPSTLPSSSSDGGCVAGSGSPWNITMPAILLALLGYGIIRRRRKQH